MTAPTKPKLVVLISGSGSNLQSFIDQTQSSQLEANIVCVISNKASAKGLMRAKGAGIATQVVDHKAFESREHFDQALVDAISPYQPDLVVLAGFMRILTPVFVNAFVGKLLNIHPSLLPKYPGLNTHQRAIDANDEVAGATIHFVTEELDGGPPVLQAKVDIQPNDTAETLAKRVLGEEHKLYPLAAKLILENRITLEGEKVFFEGEKVGSSGLNIKDIASD